MRLTIKSSSGPDYWHLLDISYYDGLEDFFSKNQGDFYYFTTKARRIYSEASYPDGAYLVFGREDAGLAEELLLAHPDSCVRVPMISQARSLNLSNTVALAAYEVLRQWGFPGLQTQGRLHRFSWDQQD